jgi:hypothetical protein
VRALSAEEAPTLRSLEGDPCVDTRTPEGAEHMRICYLLALRGCLRLMPPPAYDPPPGCWWEDCHEVTALGRLALRVAVALPAVSP